MHELGICRELIDVTLAALRDHGIAQRPSSITVEVGRFTTVVPETLRSYFTVLTEGTPLENAELRIETIPLRVRCPSCGHESEPDETVMLCTNCDGVAEIRTGRELRLVSIEVPEEAA